MLQLPGTVVVHEDRKALFDALGDFLVVAARDAVRERGVFHLALSGGSTPKPFYNFLATEAKYQSVPWLQTHVWVVDERRVPENSSRSNIRMIRESLTNQIGIDDSRVHPMPVLTDDPGSAYEATLREVLSHGNDDPVRFDFVLLGMGDDCHTASLFPKSEAIHVTDCWVVVNAGRNVTPPDRVTMTYPLLNAARNLAVLCVGNQKREALKRVAALREPDPVNVPISAIQPTNGVLRWYLDAAAVGGS